jgi:hypothetical protein
MRVSDSRVLRGIFGPGMKLLEAEENCIVGRSIICTHHKILLG